MEHGRGVKKRRAARRTRKRTNARERFNCQIMLKGHVIQLAFLLRHWARKKEKKKMGGGEYAHFRPRGNQEWLEGQRQR